MKLIFTLLIISAIYLAATPEADRANVEKPAEEKEKTKISEDSMLVLEFVRQDTFIQRYILDPRFRCKVKHETKDLK